MRHLILAFFLFVGNTISAQQYPIKQFTTTDGLAQMQVMSVLEDKRGYIWAMTKGGISKFDGERFENFTTKDGLFGNEATSMISDKQGNIWICFEGRILQKFDGKTFETFKLPGIVASSLQMYKDQIIFIKNDSLYRVSNSKIYITGLLFHGGAMIYDEKNEALHGLDWDGHINKLDIKTKSHKIISNQIYNAFLKHQNKVIARIEKGKYITLQTFESGIFSNLLQIDKNENVKYFNKTTIDFTFPFNGKTWLYDSKTSKIQTIYTFNSAGFSASNYNSQTLNRTYFPSEKGLFCVYNNGFKYFDEKDIPYAWGVVEDNYQNLWTANFSYPLIKVKNGKFTKIEGYREIINAEKSKFLGRPNNYEGINSWYFHPVRDKNGNLWFSDYNGLLKVEQSKFKYITNKNLYTRCFFTEADTVRNKILACGTEGFVIVDAKNPQNQKVVKDTCSMFQKQRLIFCATVAPNGNYWIGGRYLCLYNPNKNTFKYYTDYNKKSDGKSITFVYYDNRGGIWAGSITAGLLKYNPKTDRFEKVLANILKEATLPMGYFGQLDSNHLIMTDGLNLLTLNLDDYYLKNKITISTFNAHNGFKGLEPGQSGYFKDSKGLVYVTSGSVLSVIDPKNIDYENKPLITVIRAFNNQLIPFDYATDYESPIEKGTNFVKLKVESIGVNKSFASQFAYRITNISEEWSSWQTENVLNINGLENGKNTIEVKSRRNNFENESNSITHLTVLTNIPFYKNPSYIKYGLFALGLFLFGLISLLVSNFRKNAKIRKKDLEMQSLTQKANFLQVQTLQAQMSPHFTFNLLTSMQNLILKGRSEEANENLLKLSTLLRNYLEASMLLDGKANSLYNSEIYISHEVELLNLYLDFEKLQYENPFTYEITIDSKLEADSQKIPPMLVQPFVENGLKHGIQNLPKDKIGKLLVHFEYVNEDELKIIIEDNGVGIEKAQEIQKNSIKKHKSRGSELVFMRVEILNKMGYNIHIKHSVPIGGGTKVEISLAYIISQ